MPLEPLRPVRITGNTEEETAKLQANFKSLYALIYPHWEVDLARRLKADPPSRTDWSFVEIGNLADSVHDGPMSRWERLKLRGRMLFEIAKSLVPITASEKRQHTREVTDQVTVAFIGMWLEVLQGAAAFWGGTLDVSRLDEAMLPTGLEPGILEDMLAIGDIPFDDIRGILMAVRNTLPDGARLPAEINAFMIASGLKVSGTLHSVN